MAIISHHGLPKAYGDEFTFYFTYYNCRTLIWYFSSDWAKIPNSCHSLYYCYYFVYYLSALMGVTRAVSRCRCALWEVNAHTQRRQPMRNVPRLQPTSMRGVERSRANLKTATRVETLVRIINWPKHMTLQVNNDLSKWLTLVT